MSTATTERTRKADYASKRRLAGRDCGPIADIKNIKRRESCRQSLRLFCETYNPAAFSLRWADFHLKAIARIEEAARLGALYAFAMPRGSGKSSIVRMGALWAVSYGHCRYVFLIGANAGKAEDSLNAIRTWVRFLPKYSVDFPEISGPANKLRGIAQRAGGQVCDSEDKPTLIEWSKERIVLPTVPPPSNWPKDGRRRIHWPLRSDGMVPTSGSVIGTSGLTGDGIRGSVLTLSTGEQLRPDLFLPDDPSTDESSSSPTQNEYRESLIVGTLLGMAAPGKAISAVMPVTVIQRGDLASRFLDRKQHPMWRGERTSLLSSMPTNMKAWEAYFDVFRRCAQQEPPDYAQANAYYVEHRTELDAGAVATWEDRKIDEWGEVSAVQSAMNLYCLVGPERFAAEYQNDPLPEFADVRGLEPASIAAKVNRLSRGIVPIGATHLVAMIDVHKALLYYAVFACADDFRHAAVVDYGTYPDQGRPYFALAGANPTLESKAPHAGMEGAITAGLTALEAKLLDRPWHRESGAGTTSIELCLVDSGWRSDIVRQFCRRSKHPTILLPSLGRSIRSTQVPMSMRHNAPDLLWLGLLQHRRPLNRRRYHAADKAVS